MRHFIPQTMFRYYFNKLESMNMQIYIFQVKSVTAVSCFAEFILSAFTSHLLKFFFSLLNRIYKQPVIPDHKTQKQNKKKIIYII